MANILILTILSFINIFHPLHVSVTEIEHDAKEKRLEIVMRIFIDDLELAIKNGMNDPYLDITAPGEGYSTDGLIKNYISDKFKINVNGKEEVVEYVGHEVELPVIYLYAKVEKVRKLKTIRILNNMIMETYDDQTNLVHVEVDNNTKSLKLTEKNKEDRLSF